MLPYFHIPDLCDRFIGTQYPQPVRSDGGGVHTARVTPGHGGPGHGGHGGRGTVSVTKVCGGVY